VTADVDASEEDDVRHGVIVPFASTPGEGLSPSTVNAAHL
jgi:hypothetical protein